MRKGLIDRKREIVDGVVGKVEARCDPARHQAKNVNELGSGRNGDVDVALRGVGHRPLILTGRLK
jgi:hypothetical protein